MVAALPDRPDGMQHPARRQVVAAGRHRGPGRRSVGVALHELLEHPRSGGAMDRSVDPAAAAQRLVGRVGDRVEPLGGDVAVHELDPPPVRDGERRHRATRVARQTLRRPTRWPYRRTPAL